MSKVYRDEITTRKGNEIALSVTENHPNYNLSIEDHDCHWDQQFRFDPSKRSPGDTEIFAGTLMRLGRRWVTTYCP